MKYWLPESPYCDSKHDSEDLDDSCSNRIIGETVNFQEAIRHTNSSLHVQHNILTQQVPIDQQIMNKEINGKKMVTKIWQVLLASKISIRSKTAAHLRSMSRRKWSTIVRLLVETYSAGQGLVYPSSIEIVYYSWIWSTLLWRWKLQELPPKWEEMCCFPKSKLLSI